MLDNRTATDSSFWKSMTVFSIARANPSDSTWFKMFLLLYFQCTIWSVHNRTWPCISSNSGMGFYHRYLQWCHWYQWHAWLLFRLKFIFKFGETLMSARYYRKQAVGSAIVHLRRPYPWYQVQYVQPPHHLCILRTHRPKFQCLRELVVWWMWPISSQSIHIISSVSLVPWLSGSHWIGEVIISNVVKL